VTGYYVSFAALLSEERARELAARITVGGEQPRVVSTSREGSRIYRVVMGPYLSREEADRVGRESGQSYWVYEGVP
jgi:cell division septation protein DedD